MSFVHSKFGEIKLGDRFTGWITGMTPTFEFEVVEFRELDGTPIVKTIGTELADAKYWKYPKLKDGDYILRERIDG